MTKLLKVTKAANVDHVLKVYRDSHRIEKVFSTMIPLNDLEENQIIVFDLPTSYYLLTPKEKK